MYFVSNDKNKAVQSINQYKAPANIEKTSQTLVWSAFLQSARECWFPQSSQRQFSAFVLIAFNYEPSLYVDYHLRPK